MSMPLIFIQHKSQNSICNPICIAVINNQNSVECQYIGVGQPIAHIDVVKGFMKK